MEDLVKRIDQLKIKYETLKKEIARKIVGQEEIIDKILVAIFSNGHCLLIGVPGLAKTLMVTAISETLDLKYKRIQFTPDLMPSDIIGTEILDNQKWNSDLSRGLYLPILSWLTRSTVLLPRHRVLYWGRCKSKKSLRPVQPGNWNSLFLCWLLRTR